jgi:hypothetical protein
MGDKMHMQMRAFPAAGNLVGLKKSVLDVGAW